MAVEKVKRSLSFSLLAKALVLSLVIFAIGWWVGSQVNQQVYQGLSFELTTLRDSGVNLDVIGLVEDDARFEEGDLVKRAKLCAAAEDSAHSVGVVTVDVGRRLNVLQKKKPNDLETKSLQSQYFALEARDYFTWGKLKRTCGSNVTLVLFFYGPGCSSCDLQLDEISKFKQTNPGSVLVYSFDLSYLDLVPSVKLLTSVYSVESAPMVVVNELPIAGFVTVDRFKQLNN